MRIHQPLAITAALLVCLSAPAQTISPHDRATIVRNFQAAFNRHDVTGMTNLVTDDVRLIYLNRDEQTVEFKDKQSLATSMTRYFKDCPSCRSELRGMLCSAERVSVVELAAWSASGGERSQASVAVYEFDGSLIRTVFYFPQEALSNSNAVSTGCRD